MRKLGIFDYSSGTLHIFKISDDVKDIDEYIESEGFRAKDVYWMIIEHVYVDL